MHPIIRYVLLLLIAILLLQCEKEKVSEIIISTGEVESIDYQSIVVIGEINDPGNGISEFGHCWAVTKDPTPQLSSKTNNGARNSSGKFTSRIMGLTPGQKYYCRAYALDENLEVTYGDILEITTLSLERPIVTTSIIDSITTSSAFAGGEVIDDGGSEVTEKGICWSILPNPLIDDNHFASGNGLGEFAASISGLQANTKYYVRAYAINAVGSAYGDTVSFITESEPAVLPEVSTYPVTNITKTSAQGGGNVTDDGGATVTERGICWSISLDPTLEDDYIAAGNGLGEFIASISGLQPDTKYYARAYAINDAGPAYGDTVSFITESEPAMLPKVSTYPVTIITKTSAQGNGKVIDNGGASVTERGICWSTSSVPSINDNHIAAGNGLGEYTAQISDLKSGTKYYVRAYAINAVGPAYGDIVSFTTVQEPIVPPTVSTTPIDIVTENSAQAGGNVTDNGGATVSERGVCWSMSTDPTINNEHIAAGNGLGTFSANISGLLPGTKYYVRAYAFNTAGPDYGETVSFTTVQEPIVPPTVTTTPVGNVTENSAQSGGDVTDEGGGVVTEKGICWSTSPNPTTSDNYTAAGGGLGSFSADITGLSCNKTYYVRAFATNEAGTKYGLSQEFKTNTCTSVTDIDGNTYEIVEIGNQIWMAENLKVTHYPDGSRILLEEDNTNWENFGPNAKAYCWYENSPVNGDTYGALYTWAAAVNGSIGSVANPSGIQGVCPDGWHLPSDEEWKQLEMFLGMSQSQADSMYYRGTDEGSKLKLAGYTYWTHPSAGNNISGFAALAAGSRRYDESFNGINLYTYYWSATEYNGDRAMDRFLHSWNEGIHRKDNPKQHALSVRCIMNE